MSDIESERPAGPEETNQKRSGATLAYASQFVSILGTLVLTPFLIRFLGISGFGLYQLAVAYAGYLIFLNFGMRIIAAREVTQSRAHGKPEELEDHLAMLNAGRVVPLALLGIGAAILAALAVPILGRSLPASSQPEFMGIFWLVIANLAVGFISDLLVGIVTGYERFRASYGLAVVRGILRPLLVIAALKAGFGAIAVIAVDLTLSIAALVFLTVYVRKALRIRIRWPHQWDRVFARQSVAFGLALILGSISTTITLTVDKVILGALTSTNEVAIYSIALTLLTAFATLTLAIGTVFAPGTMRAVATGLDRARTTALVIRPGRMQLAVGGSLLGGFLVFGQEFLRLWVGPAFLGAYWPTVILFVPNLIMSCQSMTIAIIDARMKRVVRSVVALTGAVLNIALTCGLVIWLGYVGAAIATAIALLIGEIGVMNYYFHRYLDIDVFAMFRGITRRILPVIAVSTFAFFLISQQLPDQTVPWLVAAIAFTVVTGAGIFWVGFTPAERASVSIPRAHFRRGKT